MAEKKTGLTGAQYIAETIKANGITHVFYQELMGFGTVLELKKLGVQTILAHSEFGAGYMADGYAKTTGKVGFCMAQSIGACNLAAGLHDAWLANTPLVALTGYKGGSAFYKNGYQESDHKLHFAGVTKFNATAIDAQQMPHLLRQAFRAASTGKPGPAHVDVIGFAGETTDLSTMNDPFIPEPQFGTLPVTRPMAEPACVSKAAELINNAKKPLLVIGRGGVLSGASEIVYTIASGFDIPVATTPDGKTIIDEKDPLWAGIVGGYGMDCANRAAAESDLVIYVGSMVSDQTTNNFTMPGKDTQIIQIDLDASQFGKSYPYTVGLEGDARTVLEQLCGQLKKTDRKAWTDAVASYVAKTLALQDETAKDDCERIPTGRLMQELSNRLPDNAVVVADTGFSAVWANCYLRVKPGQKYARAAGSLGWAFPASLGAKCGNPDRPVICFAGDGTMYYYLTELETAVRYGINTITVINNNEKLAQCLAFPSMISRPDLNEYYDETISFSSMSFAAVANAMGAVGIRVEKAEDIGPAIEKALECNMPVVIEVVTDPYCAGPVDPVIK